MTENSTRVDASPGAGDDASSRMYSLVEVAQKTGIPMPILLRYKREHPERIPSAGTGSQQRFPEEAFAAFLEIQKQEEAAGQDLPRRGGFGLLSLPKLRRRTVGEDEEGRGAEPAPAEPPASPRPQAGSPPDTEGAARERSAAAGAPRGRGDLLKLTEISEQLGIPYPTAARYASQHADRIPHEGEGRNRRFPPEAIDVFRQIRRESKPGRPPKKKARRAPAEPATGAARPWTAPPQPKPGATAAPPVASSTGPPASPSDLGELAHRIATLEQAQADLGDEVRSLLEEIRRPVTVTASKA